MSEEQMDLQKWVKIVDINIDNISLRLDELEKKLEQSEKARIDGWTSYNFLQESQVKRQDYLDERIEKLEKEFGMWKTEDYTEKENAKKIRELRKGEKILVLDVHDCKKKSKALERIDDSIILQIKELKDKLGGDKK